MIIEELAKDITNLERRCEVIEKNLSRLESKIGRLIDQTNGNTRVLAGFLDKLQEHLYEP